MVALKEIFEARILIVDDQEMNVTLLRRMLSGAGYTNIESTLDPRTVFELHRERRYDLILLDIQMPVMDGFEVIETLRELVTDGTLPVLVVTAQPDHKLRALRAGVRDFVAKPFEIAEVLSRVHNMLEVRIYAKTLERTVRELEASKGAIRGKNEEVTRLYNEVVNERKVSERLALQMPVDSIAKRLASPPDATVDSFDEVTMLIADVVGFSKMNAAPGATTPAQILGSILEVFGVLAVDRGARVIKTLGNSLMAAAGIPEGAPDHAARAAHLALDMLSSIERFNEREGTSLQVRIGLQSGPVSADVVGRRLYVRDVWGESVNAACRMESHGVAGRIQLTDEARGRLGEPFKFEKRGALEIDGVGAVTTWFLTGRHDAIREAIAT